MQRRDFIHTALGAAGLLAVPGVYANDWPNRAIRLIVPYPPGGANDITGRIYAQHLPTPLGQPVVVENRAGAGGQIGAEAAAKSTPDGYTLLFAAIGSLTIHHVLPQGKPTYNLLTDLMPVSMGAGVPLAVAVRSSLPVKSIQELIAYAKAQSTPLTYGSAGNGSTQHMTGEYFKQMADVPLNHVAYRGSGPAMTDLLGGQIDVVFETLPALSAHATNPRLRILGVTSAARSNMLPEAPTLQEAGVKGFDVTTYYGMLAPAGTPTAIVEKVSAHMQALAKTPEVMAAMSKAGAEAVTTSPARMGEMIRGEIDKWSRVQKTANIKLSAAPLARPHRHV